MPGLPVSVRFSTSAVEFRAMIWLALVILPVVLSKYTIGTPSIVLFLISCLA